MIVLTIIFGYLLGSIPFGLLLTRAAGLPDVRKIGSGNIGATNVLRTGKKGLAAATLVLDMFKGLAAVLLADALTPTVLPAAIAAMLGHIFPVWLQFKGGKGVATAIGILLGVKWQLALAVMLLWLAVFKARKISSLAALISFGAAPVIGFLMGGMKLAAFSLMLSIIVFATHRGNIRRLLSGIEPSFRKSSHE